MRQNTKFRLKRQSATKLPYKDIQGITLSGFGHLKHAAFLFLTFAEGIQPQVLQDCLARTLVEVTNAEPCPREERPPTAVNIAFTADGLRCFGADVSSLSTFSAEFRDGPAIPYRARALGDTGESAPQKWEFAGTGNGPHALLLLYANEKSVLEALIARQKARWLIATRAEVESQESDETNCGFHCEMCTPNVEQEHFGFRDGISNPLVAGGYGQPTPGEAPLPAGEFFFGHENAYRECPPLPHFKIGGTDISAENGSYLVFRKLEQDVPAFWRFLRVQAATLSASPAAALLTVPQPKMIGVDGSPVHNLLQSQAVEAASIRAVSGDMALRLAARLVGRWPSGAPVTLSPDQDDAALASDPVATNGFRYADNDPHGWKCPIGAHIRRANPRDALPGVTPDVSEKITQVHRMLRRGRLYGEVLVNAPYCDPNDLARTAGKTTRGLLFLAVVGNIARQFEFVQQTWLNDPKFGGLWSDPDGVTGACDAARSQMTIPQNPVRVCLHGISRFVTVRAASYLFLPSLSTLRAMAGEAPVLAA